MSEFTDKMTPLESEAWDWIVRLDADEPLNEREKSKLTEWLSRSPAHVEQLSTLNEFWGNPILIELLAPSKKFNKRSRQERIFRVKPAFAFSFSFILSLLGLLLWWNNPFTSLNMTASTNKVNHIYNTQIGQQKSFVLADGSNIVLNADSQLQASFSDTSRNIWLVKGEAHFSVAKDKTRPFNVFAANGRVQAVGTAFSVDVAQSEMEILVTEGQIALALTTQKNSVTNLTEAFARSNLDAGLYNKNMQDITFMGAGDYLKFSSSSDFEQTKLSIKNNIKQLSDSQIEAKQAWKKGELMFTGQSLIDVVQQLKRYSTTQIIIADPSLAELKIGGRFKFNQLDTLLKNLELNFDLTVRETSPGQITITKNDKKS